MGIITTDELSVAMGRASDPLSGDEAAQAQYQIDRVTSYIENETGVTFGQITGDVLRKRADGGGEIKLIEWPIHLVTLIHDVKRDLDIPFQGNVRTYFDGIDTIYGLRPGKVYDITMDYGMYPVPNDIKGVAASAVIRELSTEPTDAKQITVGDVTEIFGGLLDFPPGDQHTIDNYTSTEDSWRIESPVRPGHRHNIVLNGPDFCDDDRDCW